MPLRIPALPRRDRTSLVTAVRKAIEHHTLDAVAPSLSSASLSGRLPDTARLENAAEQFGMEHPEDAAASRYFVALLESAYLVAAADGISAEERAALADLITQVTGSRVEPLRLQELFFAFDDQAEQAGIGARLDAVALRFTEYAEREEALNFATLIAIADGELTVPETTALLSLAERLDFTPEEVQFVVNQVVEVLQDHFDR